VKTVHTEGGFGSVGYRAPWSEAESRKLLLRTHTTASSAQMLYRLAARCHGEGEVPTSAVNAPMAHEHGGHGAPASATHDDGFRPAKLFSIDRVFRNETMDATHLAEFHQVEGVVADRNLTLADLIGMFIVVSLDSAQLIVLGFMRVFFSKLGLDKIRFKPAYNPYTEAGFYPLMRCYYADAMPPGSRLSKSLLITRC
jgi:phenylalanyl-tRNA synthetase alpha chain